MVMKVIIADDVDLIRESYIDAIKNYSRDSGVPLEVVDVNTGEDLVDRVRETHYDLILTDNDMGSRLTGVEAVREIRKFNSAVPIYVISGGTSRVAEEAVAAGATGFIEKRNWNIGVDEVLRETFGTNPEKKSEA